MARILIVDDEPDVRELFNITLKMAGHVTDTAKHGLEAVDKLANDSPELIVLDLMMPHMDGFGLLNHIRTQMSAKPFRVIVATAKVLEESDQEKLGSWPVVGVLNKGELDIGQMVMIVASALSKSPLKDSGNETGKETSKDTSKESDKDTKDTKDAEKESSKDSAKPASGQSSDKNHPI